MSIDGIFLKVDPSFAIVNRTVNELLKQQNDNGQKRVRPLSTNVYTLPLLLSAQKETHYSDSHNLNRRINIAIRTCACQALGFELKYIEQAIGSKEFYKFYRKSVRQSLAGDDPRKIMDNRSSSVRYIAGEVDRLHPWLALDASIKRDQEEGSAESYPHQKILSSMAYIFCYDFTKLIQLNTTIKVDDLGPAAEKGLRYSCPYMSAVCVHSHVAMETSGFPDGNYMLLLKAMIKEHRSFEADRNDLADDFEGLTMKPELDQLVDGILQL